VKNDRAALQIHVFPSDLPEASEAVGLSKDKIRDEIRSGRLRARKCGRRTILTREDVSRWLARLPVLLACVILVASALFAVAASEWQTAASQGDPTHQDRLTQPCPSEGRFMAIVIDFAAINHGALAVLARWPPGGTLAPGVGRE
jgi:excisionase family DNA binding protein